MAVLCMYNRTINDKSPYVVCYYTICLHILQKVTIREERERERGGGGVVGGEERMRLEKVPILS